MKRKEAQRAETRSGAEKTGVITDTHARAEGLRQKDNKFMKRQKKRYKNQRSAGHDSSGLLTKKDLARRLGRTERTIENWQRTGVLPFLKIHRSVYFFWADVQSHLQKYFHVVRGDEPKSRDTEETGAGSS